MIVEIPEDAEIGDKYSILYEFKQVGVEGEGMVVFSQGIIRNFDVLIIEKPAEEAPEGISTTWIILGIVLIVAIIAVIWFVAKSKKASVEPVKAVK